jgi:hypothetical protein
MPYKTQSPDTSEAAERAQIEIMRRLGPGKRFEMMRRLSRSQLKMAWSGLKRANPTLSERELQVKAVELWYGLDDARRLREKLQERGLWS